MHIGTATPNTVRVYNKSTTQKPKLYTYKTLELIEKAEYYTTKSASWVSSKAPERARADGMLRTYGTTTVGRGVVGCGRTMMMVFGRGL